MVLQRLTPPEPTAARQLHELAHRVLVGRERVARREERLQPQRYLDHRALVGELADAVLAVVVAVARAANAAERGALDQAVEEGVVDGYSAGAGIVQDYKKRGGAG